MNVDFPSYGTGGAYGAGGDPGYRPSPWMPSWTTEQLRAVALREANRLQPADLNDLLNCAEDIYKWLTTGKRE